MALHLALDATTPADVTVEQLTDHGVFTPRTVAGARWLNTHCSHLFAGYVVVSFAPAQLAQRLRDAHLVVA